MNAKHFTVFLIPHSGSSTWRAAAHPEIVASRVKFTPLPRPRLPDWTPKPQSKGPMGPAVRGDDLGHVYRQQRMAYGLVFSHEVSSSCRTLLSNALTKGREAARMTLRRLQVQTWDVTATCQRCYSQFTVSIA